MHLVLDRLVHAQGFKIEALLLVFFQGLNKKSSQVKATPPMHCTINSG
jgi:hypothetical protein